MNKPPKQLTKVNVEKIIKYAEEIVAEVAEKGASKDCESALFEAVMEAIYGKSFWKWWNKAYGG